MWREELVRVPPFCVDMLRFYCEKSLGNNCKMMSVDAFIFYRTPIYVYLLD